MLACFLIALETISGTNTPNHPSGEDELKQIDVSYDQSLAKEDVMYQMLNRMNSGQGKLLHMGIAKFYIYKFLILLNQNHTNRLLRRGHINQEIMSIVWWTKHMGHC